jgi:hypothetical protein
MWLSFLMFLVGVGELVMSYVSTPRIRILQVAAVLVAPLATIGRAEAACSPNAPVNNAIVTCIGATNGQNGTAGYGTNADTGNTITVQTGASVRGTAVGVILQTGTVDNLGGIFGGISPVGGNGINGNIITVTNSGTISGGITNKPLMAPELTTALAELAAMPIAPKIEPELVTLAFLMEMPVPIAAMIPELITVAVALAMTPKVAPLMLPVLFTFAVTVLIPVILPRTVPELFTLAVTVLMPVVPPEIEPELVTLTVDAVHRDQLPERWQHAHP